MQKSISNGSGYARTHTKLNRIILVADTCLGTRPRLCLGSSSRAGCLSGSVQSRRTLVIPAECYASPLMPTPPWTNRSKSGLRPLQRAHPGNAGYILSTGCQWAAIPKDLPPRSTLHDYFDRWDYDGTLGRIHHALYVACRELAGKDTSPSAAIIDSQSVKSAEKGGAALTRRV